MGLPKGRTNNPSGRKKNVPNKIAREIKEQVKGFVKAKLLELPSIWEKLSPKDKAQLLVNLLPYLEAKMKEVSMTIDFEKLSTEQLNSILTQIIENKRHGKA